MQHDRVYVFGQAKSHCVLATLRDLAARAQREDPGLLAKVHVLVDAMSPVAPPPLSPLPPELDFPALAESGLQELASLGMQLVRCSDAMPAPPRRNSPRGVRSAAPVGSMRAVLLEGGRVVCAPAPKPGIEQEDDVLIRVAFAGVCRTDLAVAAGKIRVTSPLVLGHEFSGVVEAVGARAAGVVVGNRVSADPRIACGRCAACSAAEQCAAPLRLGRERHGGFAEYVVLPARAVLQVPTGLSLRLAAYMEPVAAALAVPVALEGLPPNSRGLVFGDNRFSTLMLQLLRRRSDLDVVQWPAPLGVPEQSAYDFVVETSDPRTPLAWALHALRPGGRLLLKSRGARLALPFEEIVEKQLVLQGAAYGDFDQALSVLNENADAFSALLGREFELQDSAACFAHAERDESQKTLFCVSGEC